LPHNPVIGTTYEADEGLASKCKARLLPNGYLSGQLGQVLGHCAMHELYILQQTMLLASHCWNRCKHVSQHVVDCVLVVGASSTIRDSKSTTIPRIRLVMVCLLRLIHTRTIDSLGGILSGRVESLSRLSKLLQIKLSPAHKHICPKVGTVDQDVALLCATSCGVFAASKFGQRLRSRTLTAHVETTFHMIKAKSGQRLRSRTLAAQRCARSYVTTSVL